MEDRPYRQMDLRGASQQQQQQQSPDSTQDSTEVSMEPQQQQHMPTIQVHHHHSHMASVMALMEDSANAHQQHHRHHLPQHLAMPQDQNPYAAAASAQQGSFFQQGGNMLVKEEPHSQQQQQQQLAVPVFAMDQLYWAPHEQAELMEPMSPESADLCRNLTSQLEHFRKELGTYYAESSHNNQQMLEQQQQPQAAAAAAVAATEKTSIIPAPAAAAAAAAAASDLMGSSVPHSENEMLKAAIVSHPHYPELVAAHMNCHKVGAPPEVVSQIDEIIQNFKEFQPAVTTSIGVNPELDQFMVSYYTMLLKYEKEIKKTFKEAVAFCKKLEQQLQVVTNGSVSSVTSVESDERNDGYDTSEEEDSGAEVEIELDPMAKDKELKEQLMRKYSGYISSLKHEFLKKKKKGKLPKDSRQQLLNWWSLHYKWPYPSESEKASLAESTGLDQKQINNWFINQRKRHWKPSDDLTVLGGQPSQNNVPEANSGT